MTAFTINDMKRFMLPRLKAYSSIPSLSGKEKNFLKFLVTDFYRDQDSNIWRKVHMGDSPYYYYRLGGKKGVTPLPYFLVVHVDRIPNYNAKSGTPYLNTITTSNVADEFLTGQLDNIIGIVVARYLIELNIPIDILFTTKEEVVESTVQLWEMCKLSKKVPITIDIDVFNAVGEFEDGHTTLRFEDRNGKMLKSLVKMLQVIANTNNIPFSFNKGEAIVETGFLSKLEDGKYKGAHVGIPLINYHSDMETTKWECVHSAVSVLFYFFNQLIITKGE